MADELLYQFGAMAPVKGTTAQRPARPALGQVYLDTTLVAVTGLPIHCQVQFVPPATPAVWCDGTGAPV